MGLQREKKAFEGRVRRASVSFTLADFTSLAAAVTELEKEFGDIPPDAIIQYTKLNRTAAFTDGAAGTFDLDVGDGTTGDNILDGGDIDGGTGKVLAATDVLLGDGGTFTAKVVGSVDLNTLTAGACELTVFFIA